ncbi:hypothetical protein CKJ65_18700 [Mycobacterium intracellulare]|nr:hypothetical protein CKJ65_18700 [Mycobacterium intracellulare]
MTHTSCLRQLRTDDSLENPDRKVVDTARFHARLVSAAWVVVSAFVTPVAHASPDNPTLAEQTYVKDLHSLGLGDRAGFADMIQMGWNICNRLTDRASVANMTREVKASAMNISYAQAVATVRYSVVDLCPGKYALLP